MRLATLFLLLVCSSFSPAAATAPADPGRTVDIIGSDDMKYSVSTITARAGEALTIRLRSKGTIPKIAMAHNVVVLRLGTDVPRLLREGAPHRGTDFIPPDMVSVVVAKTAFAGPGETVQVSFKVPAKPGTYPFICTFAGHHQAGMKGALIVN